MAEDREHPGLEALQQAMAAGDMATVRRRLLELEGDEIAVLETQLGSDAVRRMFGRVRQRRRAAPLGRVVVLHGIMGSRLAAVDGADSDRIWVNYFRLLNGRIAELKLALDGQPANPAHRVRLAGLFPEYLPLLTELAERWEVLPFAYDWRTDIDRSADELQRRIAEWAGNRPTHLVAHSMGGLVARRFVQRHEATWRAMADGDGLAAGGRLVMLGTPNRGSFAIPLVLTGKEKLVKMLELLDRKHDMNELLDILGTFGGIYQMLPAPRSVAADDRARLFNRSEWGRPHVHAELLARGQALHDALETVNDPERMLYVAGYDQRTPFRIRIDAPGQFSYQETLDGDGRVPHELGLLPGVRTYWVREAHGDLPRNRAVLDGIHDLLQRGTTTALEDARPAARGRAADATRWQTGDEIEPIAAEVASAVLKPVPRGATGATRAASAERGPDAVLDGEEAARVEAALLRDYLGGPGQRDVVPDAREAAGAARGDDGERGRIAAGGARTRDEGSRVPALAVEVWWADITRVPGDVHAVGHYENVLPQYAELALDRMVSGRDAGTDDLVLTNLTRRGILRGALGDVAFYPWAKGAGPGKLVAVAGMGHLGGFGAPELRRLARNLTWAVTELPDAATVCTVLIGGGVGNLSVSAAVRAMFGGLIDGLGEVRRRTVQRVCIVERELGKARQILDAVRAYRDDDGVSARIALDVDQDVRTGEGGVVGDEYCLSLTLAAAAGLAVDGGNGARRSALESVLQRIADPKVFRARSLETLQGISRRALEAVQGGPGRGAPLPADIARLVSVRLGRPEADGGDTIPSRLSFVRERDGIEIAALTETAVIPKRGNNVDFALVDEAVAEMVDPDTRRVPQLARSLHRLLVPQDFRPLLRSARALVVETDRDLAKVHFEMMARSPEDDGERPLALQLPMSRQLRTAYSPPPSAERAARWPLRALVIGDPGDPKRDESLPGARDEALAVADLLRNKGLVVELLVGAPEERRDAAPGGLTPARRLEVLRLLMEGNFDLLHYAGHGDFDERDPTRTGWVFKGGLLTARELERIDLAPSLIVANACLSARTSAVRAGGEAVGGKRPSEADLLPGLADEFFRRGVRNYVGTAWEVNDLGAVMFARVFYDALIPDAGAPAGEAPTIGEALLRARAALKDEEARFGALWAAYQHYGDPSQVVVPKRDAPSQPGGDGEAARSTGGNGPRPSDRGGRKATKQSSRKRTATSRKGGGGRRPAR